jgi:phenylacetate-CoA ligase
MAAYGVTPSDVTCRDDLQKLPILTKEDVVQAGSQLLSSNYPRREVRRAQTSGTTGTALSFLTTRKAIEFQWAVWWRHRSRFGIEPGTKHLNFTGKPVAANVQQHPPFWRWNYPMSQALIGMQHISASKVGALVDFINSERFTFFSGYPSLIHSFAALAEDERLTLTAGPKCIFLGAEGVDEQQRTVVENFTGAVVTDQYGFSEGCGNASRCEHGFFHEDWEFGVLEGTEGETLEDGRQRAKLVGTGFANYAFPFIRYEIGDIGIWAPKAFQCPCGRQGRVLLAIEGRSEDYILTPEGTQIRRFDYLFKDTQGVRVAQVVQRLPGSILIRLVPRPNYSQADNAKIFRMVRDWISPSLAVDIEVVTEIPRGPSGKFRPVISELDAQQNGRNARK